MREGEKNRKIESERKRDRKRDREREKTKKMKVAWETVSQGRKDILQPL